MQSFTLNDIQKNFRQPAILPILNAKSSVSNQHKTASNRIVLMAFREAIKIPAENEMKSHLMMNERNQDAKSAMELYNFSK